tara:strand:+ start:5254 stop:5511 length:258 start_codon:yes stop_codon:yes gene_type:complete
MNLPKYIDLLESIEDSGYFQDIEGKNLIAYVTLTFWEQMFTTKKHYHHFGMQRMSKRQIRKYLEKNNLKVKGIIDEYAKHQNNKH